MVMINRTAQERGQTPISSNEYVIKPGDTLWDISKRTGISIQELARYNGIQNPNKIRAGAKLYLPQRSNNFVPGTQPQPQIPQGTPVMQNPRLPAQQSQQQQGPGVMGLGGLMHKMAQQVNPTVLGAMAGMGGAGGLAGMMGRPAMNSAMRPNPTRFGNSAMRPNPARMDRMIQGGVQNSGNTLDDLYRMFGQR